MDEHKHFIEEKLGELWRSQDHCHIFLHLNLYWNYLSYDLLDKLLDELLGENSDFKTIKEEMERYKIDLQGFRESTTLVLFCKGVPQSYCDPPPGFKKVLTKHQWPETITLEDVETFRKRFLCTLKLQDCAMMIHGIETGSFKITWFAALSHSILKENEEMKKVFREFKVISIYIDGQCVYQQYVQLSQQVSYKKPLQTVHI